MTQFSLKCWLVILQAVFHVHAVDKSVYLPNVQCKPIPTTVAVDYPQHRFLPYYVTLHRCQGSLPETNPNIKSCVVDVYRELKLNVYSLENRQWKVLTGMFNHTKCTSECQANPTDCDFRVQKWNNVKCECDCLFPNSAPPEHIIPRKNGFRWNTLSCRYECSGLQKACSEKKEWDGGECSCVCSKFYKRKCEEKNKRMDSNTCECKDIDHPVHGPRGGLFSCGLSLVFFILLIVAVVVIILFGGLLYHRCKTRRQRMKHAGSQTSQMTGSSDDTRDTMLQINDTGDALQETRDTADTVVAVSGYPNHVKTFVTAV